MYAVFGIYREFFNFFTGILKFSGNFGKNTGKLNGKLYFY